MPTDREQEIVEAMKRLTAESHRLITQHQEVMREYERLKDELETIRGRRKSVFHAEKLVECSHCGRQTSIGAAVLLDIVVMSRKRCEVCGREYLIFNDVPMTEEQYKNRATDK